VKGHHLDVVAGLVQKEVVAADDHRAGFDNNVR